MFPPEYEVREAARFSGYTWPEWWELESEEQARSIAHLRIHSLTELHGNDAVAKQMKRNSETH